MQQLKSRLAAGEANRFLGPFWQDYQEIGRILAEQHPPPESKMNKGTHRLADTYAVDLRN